MKLKCINDKGQKVLKLNGIYSSIKVDGNRVWINEWKRFSFLLDRFEVVE